MFVCRGLAIRLLALVVGGTLGCNGSTDDTTGVDPDSESRSSSSAPVFLDFAVSNSRMNEVDGLVFSAVLTDPDGVEDLIGGSLKSPEGATYGAFQTAATEGAYGLTIRWADVNAVQRIDLESGSNERTFEAEFFDAGGERVARTVSVTLECQDEPLASTCNDDGQCVSLEESDHCGTCGNECRFARPVSEYTDILRTTAANPYPHCSSVGPGCAGIFVLGAPSADYPDATCDAICGDWECEGATSISGGLQTECSDSQEDVDGLFCQCRQGGPN